MTTRSDAPWLSPPSRSRELPPAEPNWFRSRSLSYWIAQVVIYLVVLSVDWLLTTLDGGSLTFQYQSTALLGLLALMALAYAPILVRHRLPVQAFGLVWLITLALDLTGEAQPLLGLLITLHAVAAFCGARLARSALLMSFVPVTVQSYWTARYVDGQHSTADLMVPLIFFCTVTTAVWLLGRREHRAQLAAVALRQEVELTEKTAGLRERQRIARELHDILSHSVSAMMMQAAGARALANSMGRDRPEDEQLRVVHDALETIERTGSQSMRELHRLLDILRDHDLEQNGTSDSILEISMPGSGNGAPSGLDVQELVALSRRSGLTVQLHHSGEQRVLDPSINAAAYRVVQESLTNALKHAGRGAVVDVFETWQEDSFQLQVRSRAGHDGTRPGTPGSGTGLYGLRERVEFVGGRFEAGWVGDEFVTTANLPLSGSPLTLGRSEPQRSSPTS